MSNQTKGKTTNSKSSTHSMPARNHKKSSSSSESNSKQRARSSKRTSDGI